MSHAIVVRAAPDGSPVSFLHLARNQPPRPACETLLKDPPRRDRALIGDPE